MDVKKCGAFLQALRKAKGLTQAQLAEVMCVSPKTVSKWECGDAIPEITALMSLAEFYGVTVDEILKGERACAGAPVTPETEERNARANNAYILSKKQDSLKLFTIISAAIIAVGLILQIILLFTVSYIVGVCVNLALSVAACATFFAGYSLGGGHAEQYLEGDDLNKLNVSKLRVKTIIITALVCNVVQAVIPFFDLYLAVLLSPIITFVIGTFIGLFIYYRLADKYGIETPEIYTKLGSLHLPLYAAIIIYILFITLDLWCAYYNYNYSSGSTSTLIISGYACFYKCYLNPFFYIWAISLIAGILLAINVYADKVNFFVLSVSRHKIKANITIAYIIIGISFILLYFMTAYGAEMYAKNYVDTYYTGLQFNWINNDYSPLCIFTGIVYIVFALFLCF